MRVRNAKQVGSLLRETRQRQGMTQAELAEAIGVSRPWIVAVESGSPNARLDLVLRALQWVDLAIDVHHDTDADELDAMFGGDHDRST